MSPEWPGDFLLRRSPWDGHVHAFLELGEVVSEAICRHSALTSRLDEPLSVDAHCQGCIVAMAQEMTKKITDGPDWSMRHD